MPPRYAAELAPVPERFGPLVALGGSRLAAIAHRLRLLWDERAVMLPGCPLGVYDLSPAGLTGSRTAAISFPR